MEQLLTLEIASEQGSLLFSTANIEQLKFLSIPDTIEDFPVRCLAIGTTFTLDPNEQGHHGTYRIIDIKTYISMPAADDVAGDLIDQETYRINLTYIVEKLEAR